MSVIFSLRRQLEALNTTEENHLSQETNCLEGMRKTQQEDEEKIKVFKKASIATGQQPYASAGNRQYYKFSAFSTNNVSASQPWIFPYLPLTTSSACSISQSSKPATWPISVVPQPVIAIPPHQHLSVSSENPQPARDQY